MEGSGRIYEETLKISKSLLKIVSQFSRDSVLWLSYSALCLMIAIINEKKKPRLQHCSDQVFVKKLHF